MATGDRRDTRVRAAVSSGFRAAALIADCMWLVGICGPRGLPGRGSCPTSHGSCPLPERQPREASRREVHIRFTWLTHLVDTVTVVEHHIRPQFIADEFGEFGDLLAMLTEARPAWWADAACRAAPRSITWFPESSQSSRRAKTICDDCPVMHDCLAWALAQRMNPEGIWGGLGKTQRARLRTRSAA